MCHIDISNTEKEEASLNFILLEVKEMTHPKIQTAVPNELEI